MNIEGDSDHNYEKGNRITSWVSPELAESIAQMSPHELGIYPDKVFSAQDGHFNNTILTALASAQRAMRPADGQRVIERSYKDMDHT